jgi:hypothetical protein
MPNKKRKAAPLQEDRDQVNGRLTGSFSPLFWVYFPEAREVLINADENSRRQ